jgi:hypothetical protein
MKLWVAGGQCDEFIECVPSDKCNSCLLRFRCLTTRYFDNTHGYDHSEGSLSPREFVVFMERSNK